MTARERPDVALVVLGPSLRARARADRRDRPRSDLPGDRSALGRDPAYVREAAKRGVFAYIVDTDPEELQSAIEITCNASREYHSLQGAFGRRAAIEQAKGILMERHGIDGDEAFAMLRTHSQNHGRKLADVAAAVVESHLLLLGPPASADERSTDGQTPPGRSPT